MFGAKCPECGFEKPIFYGNYYCPRCKAVFSPEEWKQRLHPSHTSRKPPEPTAPQPHEPLRDTASVTQTLYHCPRCQADVAPWAVYCGDCGYRFAGKQA
jgi:DNA-directed RNA polymerase subunit RPC12/RpoP